MQPSSANSYNLTDLVNTLKHVLIVIIAGALESLLSGIQSGQIIDWASFQKALMIAGLTGVLVGLNRYFSDNTANQPQNATPNQ